MSLIHILFLFLVYCHCEQQAPPQTIVHVVSMTHLDVGYNGIPLTGFIVNVLNQYFDVYIPNTITIANQLRQLGGGPQLVYTTHPWLVSLYLDCPPGMGLHCPTQTEISNFNASIRRGDITWHAFPFNVQAEVMDESLFTYGLKLGQDLDDLFGFSYKTTMSQRDVPGITRAIIPILNRFGVKALTIGVNGGSAPPAVPKIFVWKDSASGQDIIGMVNPGGYGDYRYNNVHLPGSPHVLSLNFVEDNSGPPTVKEVQGVWDYLSKAYPGAQIIASTFDAFIVEALKVKENLPVYESEIGDTWVYGVPSDPYKISVFREISRLRTECLESGECSLQDPRVKNMSRFLIKIPEHTWGLPGANDIIHWNNVDFNTLVNDPTKNFINCSKAWLEQRLFNDHAIEALGTHILADRIRNRLASIVPSLPNLSQYEYAPLGQFKCGQFVIGFSSKGGINFLQSSVSGRNWASDDNPLAQYIYSTYTEAQMRNAFDAGYKYLNDWGFIKNGVDKYGHPVPGDWFLEVGNFFQKADRSCDFLVNTRISDPTLEKNYGAAESYWTHVIVEQNKIYVNISWFGKTPTRLPETHWFTFDPITEMDTGGYWLMDKLGSMVDPQDVMFNGSQYQHGVWDGVQYVGTDGVVLKINSLDAGIVSPFKRTPFPAPDMTPRESIMGGMSFHLFNNIWDTNYVLWYPYAQNDTDTLFRFVLEEVPAPIPGKTNN